MVAHLDITLASLVNRELKALSERMKEKYWEEKEKYWNILEKKEGNYKEEEVEGHGSEEEEEEERQDKGKKEDSERLTTESKDEVGEEKGKEDGEDKENTVKVTWAQQVGNKKEESPSEINPNALHQAEGKDWQQMLRLVMLLQNEGNFLIKGNCFQEASVKFKEALEYVDILQNKVCVLDYEVRFCESTHRINNEVLSEK